MFCILCSLILINILTRIECQQPLIPCLSETNSNGICIPNTSLQVCPLLFSYQISQGNCASGTVCCYPPSGSIIATTQGPNLDLCGYKGTEARPPPFSVRIVGGTDQAKPNEFCWQVYIFFRANSSFVGSGSLISKNSVLTSATVAKRLMGQQSFVIIGDITVNNTASNPCVQNIDISDVKLHPSYIGAANSYQSDVAVIQLKTPVTLSAGCFCTVCLPSPSDSLDNKMCTITGVGAETEKAALTAERAPFTTTLKKVELPIINQEICRLVLMNINKAFTLHDTHMCVGGSDGRDACRGDGGGPLSCQINQRWVVAGVVSVGFGCGRQGVPGIFSRISTLLPFIQQTMIP